MRCCNSPGVRLSVGQGGPSFTESSSQTERPAPSPLLLLSFLLETQLRWWREGAAEGERAEQRFFGETILHIDCGLATCICSRVKTHDLFSKRQSPEMQTL